MIYIEYDEYKKKYHEAQRNYNEVLTEKESLFGITQPSAISYDEESVSTGTQPVNTFDKYLVLKEKKRLDERLEETRSILEDRQRLLEIKRDELMQSTVIEDKIYRLYVLAGMKPKHIANKLGYSEVHIYRFLRRIKDSLNMIENVRKNAL